MYTRIERERGTFLSPHISYLVTSVAITRASERTRYFGRSSRSRLIDEGVKWMKSGGDVSNIDGPPFRPLLRDG